MGKLSFKPIARALGIVVMAALTAYGQINTGTVTGIVTDATHSAIPHARLQIRNEHTGLLKSAVAGNDGQFTFHFLPIGNYDLTVQVSGFQKLERRGLSLVAGQTLRLNLELAVGSVRQTVTVSGQGTLLNLASSHQLQTVTNREVRELPQQKLDWTALMNLGTGMSTISSSAGGAINTGNTGGFVMNGMSEQAMNLTVDGTNASSDPEEPAFGFYQQPNVINTVNTDAIGEVSVVKGIMPASVGGTLSGNVNIITKNGTNEFHGDLFEVNAVSAYEARNQFLSTRPPATFNQYGGSLGGPILHDRMFFFGSYEGVRSSAFKPLSDDVPTPYLESISPAIYTPIFAAFPKIPQPANDPTALTARFNGVGSTVQNDANGVGRLDYYFSPTNQLSLRYTRSQPFDSSPRVIAINPRVFKAHDDMYNANFIHSAGTWTSSTRVGYNSLHFFRIDEGFNADLEGVSCCGFDAGGSEYYILAGNTFTSQEDVAVNHGRHSIEFGGIVQRQNTAHTDLNTASFSYSSLSDFQNNVPSGVSITYDVPAFQVHTYQFGGYIQDNYKATPNLALNLGIRYDYFTVPKERDGRLFNRGIDPSRPQLGPGFGPYRPPSSLYNADFNNVQPRVGFAWALGSSRKTVVRGGGGIFAGPIPMYAGITTTVTAGPNVPFRSNFNRAQALAGDITYPLPHSDFLSELRSLQSVGVISSNVASNPTINSYYPNPYSVQWMIGVERELGFGTALSVGYVGNRVLKMPLNLRENLPDRLTGLPPDPTFSSFTLDTPLDASTYHSLQVSFNKRFSHGLLFGINYTRATNTSFGDASVVGGGAPQDSNNIRADLGPTPYDIRNNLSANFVYQIPLQSWARLSGRGARLLLGGWQISGIFSANDGLPFNIGNGNSSYPSDRPDIVPGIGPIYGNYTSTLQFLDPAAFAAPAIVTASGAQERPGDLGRNAYFGPGMWNWDASLAKAFTITERVHLQLRGDFFNVFNHTNLSGLVTNISSGSFGQLTSATARTVQIGARLEF